MNPILRLSAPVAIACCTGLVATSAAAHRHHLPARRTLAPAAARAAAALALHPRPVRAVARAHVAGDPAVSIVDFSFSPGTTTVHVGDAITWTNTGRQPHSATANDHGFDTGILRTGQSASHTFTAPGTYTYYCVVHPFMHGTIVVLAATSTTTSSPSTTRTPSATSPAATTPPTPTAGDQNTLPLTGADDLGAFALGVALVGAGLALRARLRTRAQ